MKSTRESLLYVFWVCFLINMSLVVLGENDVLDFSIFDFGETAEFVLLCIMELLTVCVIPLALRLFRFKTVKREMRRWHERGLRTWGVRRILMLTIPMIVNTFLYYVYMNVAFGYMAIILFLCLFFVYPSLVRCNSEVKEAIEADDI